MILKRLSILNYKNIEQADLDFSPKVNCFIGQNGMGKTNLLDAVYYLSFCKSAANPIDSQVMRHDADFFVVQGLYETHHGEEEDIYCGMKRRQKKVFKRNKKAYQRFSEHVGFIPLVMVSPSDNELIVGVARNVVVSWIWQYRSMTRSIWLISSTMIRHCNSAMPCLRWRKNPMLNSLVYGKR